MKLPMKIIKNLPVALFAVLLALPAGSSLGYAQSSAPQNGAFPTKNIVIAHEGATGVVKMRMDRMEAMGAQMKLISAMVRGKKRFDGSKIAAASEKIADHGRKSSKLFPKGSWKKPTQALPKVWKDWRGFTRAMNSMVRSATVLAEAGRAGNKKRASTAYFALGKSCVACHRTYRFKKKKRR
jgi:cytochrome c556